MNKKEAIEKVKRLMALVYPSYVKAGINMEDQEFDDYILIRYLKDNLPDDTN